MGQITLCKSQLGEERSRLNISCKNNARKGFVCQLRSTRFREDEPAKGKSAMRLQISSSNVEPKRRLNSSVPDKGPAQQNVQLRFCYEHLPHAKSLSQATNSPCHQLRGNLSSDHRTTCSAAAMTWPHQPTVLPIDFSAFLLPARFGAFVLAACVFSREQYVTASCLQDGQLHPPPLHRQHLLGFCSSSFA